LLNIRHTNSNCRPKVYRDAIARDAAFLGLLRLIAQAFS
jgi:hypothetical protein